MIVMVSTKTLSAREPDQRASTKPSEMTSNRPPFSTSSMVGTMIRLTAPSVSARWDRSITALRTSSTWAAVNWSDTKPIAPAMAKTSGGTERTAKNAASAASPVTRYFRQDATVVTITRQSWSRAWRSQSTTWEAAEGPSRRSALSASAIATTVTTCVPTSG
jgi:hypothetical protein